MTIRSRRWLVALTEYAGFTAYTGGIGRHFSSLLPAVVRTGVEVDLVVYAEGEFASPTPSGGVRLVAPGSLDRASPATLPRARALDFRRVAARRPYDAVVVPEWGGVAACLPDGAPLVTNLATSMRVANAISGVDVATLPAGRRRAVAAQNVAEDRQIRRSSGLIAISHAMERMTRRLVGSLPPVRVVPNCIDVAEVQASAASPGALPREWPAGAGPTVLFLGRLERRKGVVEAATAFGALARTHPTVRFVFAGSSGDSRFEPSRDVLVDLIGAPRRTHLLDHVPGPELFRAVATADVVVCPSRWEGFGQVALEAQAIGRPLIATRGSGFDDFCTDGVDALLAAPGDAGELIQAIDCLLQDPGAAEAMGERARARVGRFTADAVAPAFVDAVSTLVANSRITRTF